MPRSSSQAYANNPAVAHADNQPVRNGYTGRRVEDLLAIGSNRDAAGLHGSPRLVVAGRKTGPDEQLADRHFALGQLRRRNGHFGDRRGILSPRETPFPLG